MDLFDLVKAKPPPEKVRPIEESTSSSSRSAKILSPVAIDDADSTSLSSPLLKLSSPVLKLSSPIDFNTSTKAAAVHDLESTTPCTPATALTKTDIKTAMTNDIDDESITENLDKKQQSSKKKCTKGEMSSSQTQRHSTKNQRPTKAQQKQFDTDDVTSSTDSENSSIRRCCVRIKRLSAGEITSLMSPKKRRGRPSLSSKQNKSDDKPAEKPLQQLSPLSGNERKRKSNSDTDAPPVKKTTMHFKFGPKCSTATTLKTVRARRSPPPSGSGFIKRPKLKRAQLIKDFGLKMFRSYVRILKCKHPICLEYEAKQQQEKPRRSSKRSNLSVSFRDAVEIIGQDDTLSTSTGSSTVLKSVPTRLTKVENGRVVQDVELDQSLFAVPLSSKTTPKGKRKRSQPNYDSVSSVSGAGSERRSKGQSSSECLPLSGLANLSINDDDNNEDDDQTEYIVPIELPQCRPTIAEAEGTPKATNIASSTPIKERSVDKQKEKEKEKKKERKPEPEPELSNNDSVIDNENDKDKLKHNDKDNAKDKDNDKDKDNVNQLDDETPTKLINKFNESANQATTNEIKPSQTESAQIEAKAQLTAEALNDESNEASITTNLQIVTSDSESSFQSAKEVSLYVARECETIKDTTSNDNEIEHEEDALDSLSLKYIDNETETEENTEVTSKSNSNTTSNTSNDINNSIPAVISSTTDTATDIDTLIDKTVTVAETDTELTKVETEKNKEKNANEKEKECSYEKEKDENTNQSDDTDTEKTEEELLRNLSRASSTIGSDSLANDTKTDTTNNIHVVSPQITDLDESLNLRDDDELSNLNLRVNESDLNNTQESLVDDIIKVFNS